MINGFISILTRRKKAYTGRASSAMYYDEKKKRYVFDGEEDESDDDVPPPPPPKKQQPAEETKVAERPLENAAPKEENALDALTRPAFSGALAARGRGRGRGAPTNRFPQLLNPSQLATSTYVPKIEEEEKKASNSDLSRFQDAPIGEDSKINEGLPDQQVNEN